MIWNHPAALAGLAVLALPILVHLLVPRHAARVLFPAMRFVPAVRAAAVRLRAPSDLALLLLRLAIVAAAALAAAQPLLVTSGRARGWGARIARAVIVDGSPSVDATVAVPLAQQAAEGAFVSHRFTTGDLRDGVRRASEWLASAPAARHDMAIVSDFQRGAIDEADLQGIPASTGITLVRTGSPKSASTRASADGWRGARWDAALTLTPRSSDVIWTRRGAPASGLTVRASAVDQVAADRAADAARSFGVPVADPARRIEVAFAGATGDRESSPRTAWIAGAAIALLDSALVSETGADVTVGERDGMMTVKTTIRGNSPFAPAVMRAVLLAAAPGMIDPEGETVAIDDGVLARFRRDPAPVTVAPPPPDASDGRWLWAVALALLGIESLVRRRSGRLPELEAPISTPRAKESTHADAA